MLNPYDQSQQSMMPSYGGGMGFSSMPLGANFQNAYQGMMGGGQGNMKMGGGMQPQTGGMKGGGGGFNPYGFGNQGFPGYGFSPWGLQPMYNFGNPFQSPMFGGNSGKFGDPFPIPGYNSAGPGEWQNYNGAPGQENQSAGRYAPGAVGYLPDTGQGPNGVGINWNNVNHLRPGPAPVPGGNGTIQPVPAPTPNGPGTPYANHPMGAGYDAQQAARNRRVQQYGPAPAPTGTAYFRDANRTAHPGGGYMA